MASPGAAAKLQFVIEPARRGEVPGTVHAITSSLGERVWLVSLACGL